MTFDYEGFRFAEWELLHAVLELKKLNKVDILPSGVNCVRIFRNDDFQITAEFSGTTEAMERIELDQRGSAGELIRPQELVLSDKSGNRVVLSHSFRNHESRNDLNNVTITFDVSRVQFLPKPEPKYAWYTVWFLCGKIPRISGGLIERDRSVIYSRKLPPMASSDHSSDISLKNRIGTQDFGSVVLECASYQCRLRSVPSEFCPDWSHSIAIDIAHDQEWNTFRDDFFPIVEGLSWILGRQLLYVGHTAYTESGQLCDAIAQAPYSPHPRLTCLTSCNAPVLLGADQRRLEAPNVLSDLTSAYVKHRDTYSLDLALYHIWTASTVACEQSVVLYLMALEAIVNRWFEHSGSVSRGMILSENDFDEIKGVFEDALKSSSVNQTHIKRIIPRFNRLNELGATQKLFTFFNEIALPISEYDKSVINCRHRFAHGARYSNSIEPLLEASRALATLLNRVILKLVGFSGEYIDYSTIGFPSRTLDEPMGGWDGNRTPIKLS